MKLRGLLIPFTVMLLVGCGQQSAPADPPKEKETLVLQCSETFLQVGKGDIAPRVSVQDYDNIDVTGYTMVSDATQYVTVVDNKLHAVAVGSANITLSKAEDDTYKYKSVTFKATVFTAKEAIDIDPFDRTYTKVTSTTAYVRKVENLDPQGFIMGMDISSVIAEEEAGVKYYDFEGNETDVFKVLSDYGVNYIRVRIWNDPKDAEGNSYGGGHNDLATAIKIGKRATKYNMSLLVNFHYSDFWADPSRQIAPKAWANLYDISEKETALYQYTKDSLQAMKDEGIVVGMVQVGNETSGGKMAGETLWKDTCKLFNAGSRAVREVYPNALVALHFANPEKYNNYFDWASKVNQNNVDYDVFGSSYYPYWHGTLDNLSYVLSTIAAKYNKRVMVLETSYAFTGEDSDFGGNTIGETSGYDKKDYPFTVHGQINQLVDVVDTIANRTVNGLGICYWEGAWITAGGSNWEENKAKWEQYGCGWASDAAHSYDPNVGEGAGGGSMVDNQTFFDKTGHPLESLKAWNLLRFGNEIEKFVDGVEDVDLLKYDNETFALPETVNAIYCDNSKAQIPVTWEAFDIEAAKARGNNKYVINGVAGGMTVHCNLTIMEYNFVSNYSFENGRYDPWKMNTTDTLSSAHIIKITNENPQTGKYASHFWTSDPTGVNFNIEQEVTGLEAGKYKLQVSMLGGGSGTAAITPAKQDVYIYIKVGGTIVAKQDHKIKDWNTGYEDVLLKGINLNGGTVVVGINVTITEANCWGDIDDVMFNKDN